MLRILIVEDDPATVSILETLLRAEGHLVQSTGNGATGLERVRTMLPDVLLTDVELPGLTGNQLTAAVRADPRIAGTYVIVLTVHGAKGDKMKSLLSGADDFMVKPARPEEIAGRVEIAQRVLRTRRESQGALRKLAAPDAGTVAALEVALVNALSSMAEAELALESGKAEGALAPLREAGVSLERALTALKAVPGAG